MAIVLSRSRRSFLPRLADASEKRREDMTKRLDESLAGRFLP
jgi:hypothetical protein